MTPADAQSYIGATVGGRFVDDVQVDASADSVRTWLCSKGARVIEVTELELGSINTV